MFEERKFGMRNAARAVFATAAAMCAAGVIAAVPWSGKPVLDDPQEFHFAIVADRTGRERPGFFMKAMQSLNLLRPEFVICVGDLINGVYGAADGVKEARRQQKDLKDHLDVLDMRFYQVVGNHDINLGWPKNRVAHDASKQVWQETYGTNTYYDFMHKGCHFVCLDSMDGRDGRVPPQGITDEQYAWARKAIANHADARWTFIFMHMPLDWCSDKWLAFERDINALNYTVFCGDWHNHVKAVRHGKNYYMIGTTGGVLDYSATGDDLRYGILDSITWVTVTKKEPVVSNIALSGIHGDEIQRCATTKGWMETALDYPDHYTEPPERYSGITNPAIVPKEVMSTDRYDWHFRHAMITRNNDFVIKPDVVLAGDAIAHYWSGPYCLGDKEYATETWLASGLFKRHRVMNMGFGGDRTQNLLWRILHGELEGTSPKAIVLLIGADNLRAGNTPGQTAEGIVECVRALHGAAPQAQVFVYGVFPFGEKASDPCRARVKETNARVAEALAADAKATFRDIGGKFLDANGDLPKDVMHDFLHPTAKGYAIWEEAILSDLSSLPPGK